MKINEFNIPYVTKTIGGQSKEQATAAKTFINNFIGKISADIAKGIKGKVINPQNTLGGPGAATAPASTTAPAATTPTTPPATTAPKVGTKLELVPKDLELMPKESKHSKIKENKFQKLNTVFESIINADQDIFEQGSYPDTISTFVQNTVKQYVGNIDTSKYDAKIKELADRIENDYNSMNPMLRGGRKALTELGNIIYLITSGALQTQQMSKKSQAFSKAASSNLLQLMKSDPDTLSNTIMNALAALKKVNPQEYSELMQTIRTAKPVISK